jgi:photosystem II stability/assembly factor-like uncharacterized protein
MKSLAFARSLSIVIVFSMVLMSLIFAAPAGLANGAVCPDFFWQNPLPQGNTLNDVAAVDASTAWVAGDYGTIMKTTDGGATWQRQVSGTTSVLHAIDAVNADTAWACGEDYTVLRTVDGGSTWTQLNPDIAGDYYGISAIDGQTAWVVGVNILGAIIEKTTDGGGSWTDQSPSTGEIADVSAVSANIVWALSAGGTFFSSTDGGSNWNAANSPGGGNRNRLQAFNATTAYAVTDFGHFIKTTNGTDFTVVDVGPGGDLKALAFIDQQSGWVVGEKGFIGVTSDAGAHWAAQLSGTGNMLYGVDVTAAGQLYTCGMSGEILRSAQPAGPWRRISTGDTDMLHSLTAAGDRSAWACGDDGTIVHTQDGGATWRSQVSGVTGFLNDIDAFSVSVAWSVGENGAILRTTDAGATWSALNPGPAAGANIMSVSVLGPDSAWVSGENGLVMKTSDGGTTWERFSQGSNNDLKVKGLDANTAYCIRDGKAVVTKTVDGGKSWTNQVLRFTGNTVSVTDLCIVNKDVAYASAWVVETGLTGDYGMAFKTTDGGAHWKSTMSQHANLVLECISSADGKNVWTSGLFGLTFKSTDGANTWQQQDSLQNDAIFYGAEAVDGQTAWLVGAGGYIVRTTAPYLYSISPSSALNNGAVNISELAGNGFQPGMQVKMVKGGSQITATNVRVHSPYRATCAFDLAGAAEGDWDVVATNTNGLEGRLRGGFHVSSGKRWYLAEGSTGESGIGLFETWVLLQNPGAQQTTAQLTYLTPQGSKAGPKVVLRPNSRTTVNVADTLSNTWEVSTSVESDRPIVVERAMYWDSPGVYRESASGSIGTTYTAGTWYLAEGSTGTDTFGRFDTYVTVANPGGAEADVALTFMTPGGPVAGPTAVLGAGRRWTVDASGWVPNQWSVSTEVNSNNPVVAERSVYWNSSDSFRTSAHNSIGATETSSQWFLAEGSTGNGAEGAFDTWVVLQNPGNYYAEAMLEFDTPSGKVAGPKVALEPYSRQSVQVADSVPDQYSISTKVVSDNPIVVERSTYFNSGAVYRQAAQSSIGAGSPATEWELAEGSTGSNALGAFETWVLVQNPGAVPAQVAVEYMTADGPVQGPTFTLGANSRTSINAGDTVPGNWSVSTRVTSNVPVVSESALYWNATAVPRQCAQDSIGFPFQ